MIMTMARFINRVSGISSNGLALIAISNFLLPYPLDHDVFSTRPASLVLSIVLQEIAFLEVFNIFIRDNDDRFSGTITIELGKPDAPFVLDLHLDAVHHGVESHHQENGEKNHGSNREDRPK